MTTPPAHKLTLTDILSESQRILTTNYTPLFFYLITTPIFHLSGQLFTLVDFINFLQTHISFIILTIYLFSLCAIATITYTTQDAFIGTPINKLTSLKSLKSSFFPIITTAVIAHTLLILISLSFLLLVEFVYDHNLVYFTWLSNITCLIFIVLVTYVHVNWLLAFVVVVVESKSGFEALRRSSDLVKGVRWVSLALFLYFGCFFGVSVCVLPDGLHALSGSWYVVVVMVLGCGWMMFLLSYMTAAAATTVLYSYCRGLLHGEVEIDGLFDEKITCVVEA